MKNIHNAFSNVSETEYAEIAVLARMVGEHMVSRLELVTLVPKRILLVGHEVDVLQELYPAAEIMTDINNIKNKMNSVDFIFANLSLPWENDWKKTFSEWQQWLRPEGLLVFSCLGLDTLRELPSATLRIQRQDMHDIGDQLVQAKFADPVMDVEYLTFTYKDQEKMCYELVATGMLESPSTDTNFYAGFPITYEVIYGHCWGKQTTEDGVVKIPLSALRRS